MTQEGTVPPSIPSSRRCPVCGKELNETALYCPRCGHNVAGPLQMPYSYPYYRPPSAGASLREVGGGIGSFATLPLLGLLAINVVILIWSIWVVAPIAANPAHGNTLFLIIPWTNPLLTLFPVDGIWFLVYHVLLVIAITASFAWLIWKSYEKYAEELSFKAPTKGHSPLYAMGTIFFAVLAFDFIWAILVEAVGATPISPPFGTSELWQLLDGFASASVWEELVTRVLWLGVPLLLIDLATKKMTKPAHYLLGGGFGLGKKELFFLLFSSALFSWAHIVYWDAYKIPPTFVAGLALGYLFLRFGLYACIMLHFSFDYLTIPMAVWDSVAVLVVLSIVIVVWEVVGGGYLISYLVEIYKFIFRGKARPSVAMPASAMTLPVPPAPAVPHEQMAPIQTQPYPGPPPPPRWQSYQAGFAWRCPYCGYTEASYQEGRFTCLRCGRQS
jgi:DNA-directed RNA polymerase subunit RPC12/RpoP